MTTQVEVGRADKPNAFKRWLWLAKPLPWWGILLAIVLCALRSSPMLVAEYQERRPAPWTVPAETNTQHVSAFLEEPLLQHSGLPHGHSLFWGKMTLDDGTLFWFTCVPGNDDPICAYNVPANRDVNLGKHYKVEYFDVISHRGSNHVILAMQQDRCENCTTIMTYASRRAALDHLRAKWYLPTFNEWMLIVLLAALGPPFVYRIATGRAEALPPTK